jgi:ParB family transcriptional regulator, chromosome partitioning protein
MSPSSAATTATLDRFEEKLPLDRIELTGTNPRKHINESSIEELAESIKVHGVVQPVTVRPNAKRETGWYELVFGERRFRACRKLGLPTIPALVRHLDDDSVIELQIIENVQREDVHELDEANGYNELIERGRYDVKSLAAKIGKSKEYIYKRLKLAGAVPEIQKLFFAREVTAGHVEQIARLPEVSQTVVLEKGLFETVHANGSKEDVVVSVRDLSAFISEHIHSDLGKAIFDVKDPQLLPAAGACGPCAKRFGSACADRACFNQKLNAFSDAKVKANEWIAATCDYGKQSKTQPYFYYLVDVKPGSCTHIQTAVCINGNENERGKTKTVCPNESCGIHYPKPKDRQPREPVKKKEAPKLDPEKVFRTELWHQVNARIDSDILSGKNNPLPIAKTPLLIIGRAILDHVQYLLTADALKTLGLPYTQKDIDKQIEQLSAKQLAALIFKVAVHPDIDDLQDDGHLRAAAAFYKIDPDRLKAQVIARLNKPPDVKGKKTLEGALHSALSAENPRWKKLQQSGASNAEIKAAIGEAFGIEGASNVPVWHAHRGGKNPRFYMGTHSTGKPKLQGKALVQKVRELLAIPEPKVSTSTKSKKKAPRA